MKNSLLLVALLLSSVAASAQQIPPGTTLPVELNSTLNARHLRPGQKITGTLKQDVALPDGSKIPERTQIAGHVISATPASSGSRSTLTIAFDQVLLKGRPFAVTTHLRALASVNDVFEAKMPTNSWDDYGTSPSDWNTIQVGGAGVYRGNGQLVAD